MAEEALPSHRRATIPCGCVAAHEARCFHPSTFASRRQQAPTPPPERLVSLGISDWPRRLAGGEAEVLEIEVFCNVDKPMRSTSSFPTSP